MDEIDDPAQLVQENEILRKSLVKVSFAAAGVHATLDAELQTLRQVIRAESNSSAIHAQVESIARVLRVIDDDAGSAGNREIEFDELIKALGKHLQAELPDSGRRIRGMISRGATQPLIVTLSRLAELMPSENYSSQGVPEGFLARLVSRFVGHRQVVASADYVLLQRIGATVHQLLEHLQIPEQFAREADHVQQEFGALVDLQAVPTLMERISALVLQMASEDHSRFERFLKQLGERLQLVQDIIVSSAEAQRHDTDAGGTLDRELREQMSQLQVNVQQADSLDGLQQRVNTRLDGVISSLDRYRDSHHLYIQHSDEQMALLRQRLEDSHGAIEQLRSKLQQQQALAETDALTRLPNRHAYQRRLNDEYSRWRRYRSPLSIAVGDIDHFKRINDAYGHPTGDKVLQHIAIQLQQGLRESDFVARYGGEEFVLLMPETTLTQATKAVNKLRVALSETRPEGSDDALSITVSFGVAEFEDIDTATDVVARADRALYRAKERGRNQVCCELRDLTAE